MTARLSKLFAVRRAAVDQGAGTWRRVATVSLLTALCVAILPTLVFAQGGASITGIVRDSSGAVLPGATVEASSPVLIEKVRSVISGGDGQYRIINLLPGTYTLTATLTGFSTYKREGLELTGDFTATINVDLRVGAQEETVTVTGAAPIVDVQGVQRQRVLTNDVVDSIPSGKHFANLGLLIPGVSASCAAACQQGATQDTGGSAGDNSATLVVHGSRYRDMRISINNVVIASNSGYTGVTGPNIEAMQETQIDTSGADASIGAGGVRINVVPKDGGNNYRGSMFLTGTNSTFQVNNLTQDLKNRGLTATSHIKSVYDIAPTFGGPIKKDKLWFFLSYRYNNANDYAANIYQNANKNNPNVWTYAPDLTQPGVSHDPLPMAGGRLTWQATPRNKFGADFEYRDRCQCTNLGNGGAYAISPDAATDFRFRPENFLLLTWASPVTNKLLLEVGGYYYAAGWGNRPSVDAANVTMLRVTEQSPPASYFGISTYRGAASNTNWDWFPAWSEQATATYVTGAHAAKVGFNLQQGTNNALTTNQASGPITSYRLNGGQPNQFTVTADPTFRDSRMRANLGVFAQDKWTVKRLTLSGGLRFDYLSRDTPQQTLGPSLLLPARNIVFPQFQATKYEDLSPRLGLAYDVFGTGKTAVKMSLNRYLGDLSLFGNTGGTPINNYQSTASRTWTDSNHNFYPDCDFTNPVSQNLTAVGGDICGPFIGTSANFNTAVPTSVDDHNVDFGWSRRPYNWEFATSVQQELVPQRVAVDVGFFRRWYGNFTATNNPLTTSADYGAFSVVVPSDSQLPLSGQTLTFLDPNPNVSSLVTTNQVSLASKYGAEYEHWQGIDVGATARFGGGAVVQVGMSTGKQATDSCAVVAAIPESPVLGVSTNGTPGSIAGPLGVPFCHQQTPFLTQWKGLATYTIPHLDVQLSGTFQDNPGPQLAATLVVPGGAGTPVATQLGRALSTGNATVNIIAPGTVYGQRVGQTDFRVGKIIRFAGNRRATVSIDLYNVFNGNAVLTQTSVYPTSATAAVWGIPQLVQQARLVKFTLSANF